MQQPVAVDRHVFAMPEPVLLDAVDPLLYRVVSQDHSHDLDNIRRRLHRLLQSLSNIVFKGAAEDDPFVLQKINSSFKVLVENNRIFVLQMFEPNRMN